MFEQVKIPVLGVIENMSYFIAPDTGNRYEIFGRGGGQKLCDEFGLNFLGEVPMGMEVREGGDSGVPVVVSFPESPHYTAGLTLPTCSIPCRAWDRRTSWASRSRPWTLRRC